MEYEITTQIRELNNRVNLYSSALESALMPCVWWRRRSTRDCSEFIVLSSSARAQLFCAVEQTYPELRGKVYSVTDRCIRCEDDRDGQPLPTDDPGTSSHD